MQVTRADRPTALAIAFRALAAVIARKYFRAGDI